MMSHWAPGGPAPTAPGEEEPHTDAQCFLAPEMPPECLSVPNTSLPVPYLPALSQSNMHPPVRRRNILDLAGTSWFLVEHLLVLTSTD